MDQLPDKNLTADSVQPAVAFWESTPHMSAVVENTIVVLGALTFVLQLCVALFFMLKCWRLERRARQAEKPSDIYKPPSHQVAAAPSPIKFTAVTTHEDAADFLSPPSIPWDLVQSA